MWRAVGDGFTGASPAEPRRAAIAASALRFFTLWRRQGARATPRRHSRMSLAGCQNTPALDAAIYYPDSTLYQLQPSFHT